MGSHEAILAEVAGALGILGLLLVFLPLYIQRVVAAGGGKVSADERKKREAWAWAVPVLISLASLDATLGLFAIWGKWGTADLTGWLLLALVWLIVAMAALTVRWWGG